MNNNFSIFKSDLKAVPIALNALHKYTVSSNHVLTHLKIIYNVFDESALIEGTFSNKVQETEITSSLIETINYVYHQIFMSYLMTYKRVFLSRIIIESDIDMLGVVFDSIQVTCRFKTNSSRYAISESDLLKSILMQTVQAEKSEVLERPVTTLELHLLRHKLRSVQLITDYNDQDCISGYQKQFETALVLSLVGLIDTYKNAATSHQASAKLAFTLKDRSQLFFKDGVIHPSQELAFKAGGQHFVSAQIEHVLLQTGAILTMLDHAQITGLQLNMSHQGSYKCSFELVARKQVQNFIDLAALNTLDSWTMLFNAVIDLFSIHTLAKSWLQYIRALVVPSLDEEKWLVKFDQFVLVHNFAQTCSDSYVMKMIHQVGHAIDGHGCIKEIALEKQGRDTKMLKLQIDAKNTVHAPHFKPLSITNCNGDVIHFIDLSEQGYYLKKDIYKKLVK